VQNVTQQVGVRGNNLKNGWPGEEKMSEYSNGSATLTLEGATDADRRVAVRRGYTGRVILVFMGGAYTVEVRAEDISATGMGVIVDRDLKMQFKCQIHLQLPGRDRQLKTFHIQGKTVNSTLSTSRGGFRIGLVFLQPPPEFKQAVEAYVKR
jgi:hypothetical protein